MDKSTKIDMYKIRLIHVDGDEYGFDEVDMLLIDLKTYLAIGEFNGDNQDEEHFTREDFDFY